MPPLRQDRDAPRRADEVFVAQHGKGAPGKRLPDGWYIDSTGRRTRGA